MEQNIYVFGAGKVAKYDMDILKYSNVHIVGILVSKKENNPEQINNIPVLLLSQIKESQKDIPVVLGVGKLLQQEAQEILWQYGFNNLMDFEEAKRRYGTYRYTFINRSQNSETMCMMLAGYKEFLWDTVIERIARYKPVEMDMCIVSSGLYNEKLDQICEQHGWSYLYTNRNCITLVQNLAIENHPCARIIFKLDEDIFITRYFFYHMTQTYDYVLKNTHFLPGIIVPLIPLNGYGHVRLLERLQLVDTFEKQFDKVLYKTRDYQVEQNPEVAAFFWGEGNIFPQIDDLAETLHRDRFTYSICPIRFSIGAMLLPRETWEAIGKFVDRTDSSMLGTDEEQLGKAGCLQSRPIFVSENTVAGHLSFFPQNAFMKEYFQIHKGLFQIKVR